MLTVTDRPLQGGTRPRARAVEPADVPAPPRPEDPAHLDAAVALAVHRHALAVALDDELRSPASGRLRHETRDRVLEARCERAAARRGRLP